MMAEKRTGPRKPEAVESLADRLSLLSISLRAARQLLKWEKGKHQGTIYLKNKNQNQTHFLMRQ